MTKAAVAVAVVLAACQSQTSTEQGAKKTEGAPVVDAKASPHGSPASPHGSASPHGDMKAGPHGESAAIKKREPVNPHEVTVSGVMRDEAVPGLTFKVPAEWVKKPGGSPMRLAEFTLPGPGGDAELAVFRFAGGGGNVASNIARWRSQFTGADGKPLGEADGKVQESSQGALKITVVDLSGTYVAQVTPGGAERYDDAEYRMLSAIVEGSGDPYFFKAVGPAKTMALWEAPFSAFTATFAVAAAP
jgi:hypothetical protein